MEMRLLRMVHEQILPKIADAEAKKLEQLLQLVECTCDLQSEPAAKAGDLLARLQAVNGLRESILEISRRLRSGLPPAIQDWLLLSYLAMLKWMLRDRWNDCYAIIFDAYRSLGEEIKGVLARIEDVPFADAMRLLETDWDSMMAKPGFDIAALLYVRACGLMGVFAGNRLYEKLSECLAYEMGFLVVVLAAACFKVKPIASRVDIGVWTDTQYGCMRLLDNFAQLGETAWG